MSSTKHKLHPGDIFTVPLFLPSYQKWRKPFDEFIDYRNYQFHQEDIYAFGRLIEPQPGNMDLIEIFSYAGTIPESSEVIIHSQRLFEPVMMVGAFSSGRWRSLFHNPHYDKWADSDYGNICFLMGDDMGLWKGGENSRLTWQQGKELKQSGIPYMIVHGSIALEQQIRSLLSQRGLELNYEQIVEARRNEYPKPRDLDKKLKETISPFQWLSENGRHSFFLYIDEWNRDCFEKYHMLGNGYDWEKAATAFIQIHMPAFQDKFTFDCEADTFSVQSRLKKALKTFALAFHKLALDSDAFEELLKQSQQTEQNS